MINTDEWVSIPTKKKNNSNLNKVREKYNPTFDELKSGIIKALEKYNPYSVFLYGSRARGNHKIESDADILVIWKRYPSNLELIKKEIMDEIRINIDFVNLLYKEKRKEVVVNKLNDIEYYNNVLLDAINIYTTSSNKIYLQDIILHSEKLPKV
jgi:predicted nucleotidyltransferase